jgi:hypothetical protein
LTDTTGPPTDRSDDAAIRAVLPMSCPLERLPALARDAAGGSLRTDLDAAKRAYLVAEWLRWSLDEEADRRWQYLAKLPPDKRIARDGYVEELLDSLTEGGANHALAREIEKLMEPWDSYRKHFFAWFLQRFDFRAASRIYSPRRPLSPWTGWLLAALAALAEALCVRRFGLAPTPAVAVFSAVAAILVLVRPLSGLPPEAYVRWLTPRLAAAVGFGYLFLTSASSAVHAMFLSHWLARNAGTALVLLLGAAWLYVIMHIDRRVRPGLDLPALLLRSADVLALAACYAAAGLLLAAPLLFSPVFLGCTPEELRAHPVLPHHLALCAAIALNLGVVLQLAWDEKPLTEPL